MDHFPGHRRGGHRADQPAAPGVTVNTAQPVDTPMRAWIGVVGAVGAAAFGTAGWQLGGRLPTWPFIILIVAGAGCMVILALGVAYPRIRAARHPVVPAVMPELEGVADDGEPTYRLRPIGWTPAPTAGRPTLPPSPSRRELPG